MNLHRPPVRQAALLSLAALAAFTGGAWASGDYVSGQMVVSMYTGYPISEVNDKYASVTLGAYPEADLYLITVPSGWTEVEFQDSLRADSDVEEAEVNYYQETPEAIRQMVISATGGTVTEYADQQAALRVGVDAAHTRATGLGVTVAILDTGLDVNHPVFAERVSPERFNFLDYNDDVTDTADGIDEDGDGMIDEGHGHGTMVAGIVHLVAPDATILPIRVLDDEGHGDSYHISKGIRYAQFHGAQILNMSFGVPRHISMIAHELDVVTAAGMVVVAGAGNEDRSSPTYFPADYSKAIMVTALDSADVKASFADYNSKVFVSAPGDGIRSAFPGGGWATGSGCSFATPFVAGEAALLMSVAPGATKQQCENWIANAVAPIYQLAGNQPYDGDLGTGRVDLADAVDLATAVSGVPDVGPARPRVLAAPNPSRGRVEIRIPRAPAGQAARAEIYDVTGRRIREIDGIASGLVWDGRDAEGRPAPAGTYFARVRTASGAEASARMVLIR